MILIIFIRLFIFFILIKEYSSKNNNKKENEKSNIKKNKNQKNEKNEKNKKNLRKNEKKILELFNFENQEKVEISQKELELFRDETREAFLHSYQSYLKYAFPYDELMPMSCKPRSVLFTSTVIRL